MSASHSAIDGYDRAAPLLAERYDNPALLKIHDPIGAFLPSVEDERLALDVGAGSGRDAAWLAE